MLERYNRVMGSDASMDHQSAVNDMYIGSIKAKMALLDEV
jgi:hypothetical protein